MRTLLPRLTATLLALALVACGEDDDALTTSTPPLTTSTATLEAVTAPETAPPTSTPTPAPSPTPEAVRRDIRATRLTIPTISLDAEVQPSQTIPYVYVPEPGCPPGPEGNETVTVPNQGIATPEDNLEGLENKAWIYGHSRWLGVPGLFFGLQDLNPGDELLIDGVDRRTGEPMTRERFVVDGLYLSDIDSGDTFLTADDPSEVPPEPIVVLQTSVRERGANRPWILDRAMLLSKTENIVEGDLDDPCKYLLLFVTASPG